MKRLAQVDTDELVTVLLERGVLQQDNQAGNQPAQNDARPQQQAAAEEAHGEPPHDED